MSPNCHRIAALTICLGLQSAWAHESPLNANNIFKRQQYGTPPGGWENVNYDFSNVNWNDPNLYRNPGQPPVPASTITVATPPVLPTPVTGQGSSQVGAGKDGKADLKFDATSGNNSKPLDGQHDNGKCTTSTAQCPPGCQMNIKFTTDSLDVPFTAGNGGHSAQTSTKNACICMTGGSVRVNIGSNNPGDHTTLVEGNAAGLNDNSFFDVSYVEGYSYPVVCWNDHDPTRMSGSNIDLYAEGKCSDPSKTKMGDICNNDGYVLLVSGDPAHDCWKCTLPSAFFAPASGAAYAYPYDDCPCASDPVAGQPYQSPMATGGDLTCCIGPQCCANTMTTGGQTRKGNCNRPDCMPCSAGFSWGHCDAKCNPGAQKRDYERVLHQASLRKRHHHHQHGQH